MKPQVIATTLALFSAQAAAHTIFQELYVNGVSAGHLKGIRHPTFNGPITDVTSNDVITIINVPAGATITHEWHHSLKGPEPSNPMILLVPAIWVLLWAKKVYLAKVPDATQESVTGLKWFKIAEDGKASAVIPKCIPSGNYFLRAEIVALHGASTYPGAQFYMGCAQINVTGGGNASPATVSFPGTYSGTDPGITVNIYYPPLTNYVIPGPRPFTCDAGSSPTTPATPNPSTTSRPTSTTAAPTTSAPPTSGTVPKYGQCGGIGWTGATQCVTGSTCKVINEYYYQCT
ncbi:hydrolase family 61 [Rhizoctonia solani]|uniref:AA9 family lytic polysaccharide monooxygenase n=1 Tax=Rhizoctonia solani TaxID=456999 RepID=A0A8H7ID88_9AGAM|nr:hydrolase family 61 [Rhizoctonia solani]